MPTATAKNVSEERDYIELDMVLIDPLRVLLNNQKGLLTREEEHSLARKIHGGCLDAKNELIERNSRLVLSIARKYEPKAKSNGIELSDLVQEGNIGLIRAAEMFDPGKGFAFSTYATYWIRRGITRHIENSRLIKITKTAREMSSRISEVTEEFINEHNYPPSLGELSSITGITEEDLIIYRASTNEISSLDAPIRDDSTFSSIGDFVSDPNSLSGFEDVIERESGTPIILAMRSLNQDYIDILEATFGFYPEGPLSLTECADRFGISTVKARERLRLALIALRKVLQSRSESNLKSDETIQLY